MSGVRITQAMIRALALIEHGRAAIRRVDTGYALQKRGLAEPFREEHADYVGRVYVITEAGRAALDRERQ